MGNYFISRIPVERRRFASAKSISVFRTFRKLNFHKILPRFRRTKDDVNNNRTRPTMTYKVGLFVRFANNGLENVFANKTVV